MENDIENTVSEILIDATITAANPLSAEASVSEVRSANAQLARATPGLVTVVLEEIFSIVGNPVEWTEALALSNGELITVRYPIELVPNVLYRFRHVSGVDARVLLG